ncbi:MAG: hypothetical protein JOZ10_17700 [Acidobacteria bacterium]|nr:hypothetical protein [Acidobacteriota bacterium]MBV9145907.1 hypothetical protein [Acidobacteriota bacterium]MBV9435794.1 hypothetical protein [Acidobacteriota bacterium]
MTRRFGISAAIGTLLAAPVLMAQQAIHTPAMAFAGTSIGAGSTAAKLPSQPIRGERDVLEMVAERLDLSMEQEHQLESLLGSERQSVAQLHHQTELSDEQKSIEFQQIRRKTKERFASILTRDQRQEFESMMR